MIPDFTTTFGGVGDGATSNDTALTSAASAVTTTLSAAVSAGATSAIVASAAGMSVGNVIQFPSERRVLTAVSGTTITWSVGLTDSYASGTTIIAYRYERIYMPEGVYHTSLSNSSLADLRLVGPGQVERGSYMNQLRTLNTNPGYNTDPVDNPYGEDKVSQFSDAEVAMLQANPPRGLNLTPGMAATTTLSAGISANATSASLASATGFTVGDTIEFAGGSEKRTIASVTGTTVTWAGGLSNSYASGTTVVAFGHNTRDYFGAQWTPHWTRFDVMAGQGHSGLSARIPSGVSAGATSAVLNSAAGFNVGDVIGFGAGQDGPWTDTRTITGISGNTISWTGGLTFSYPLDSVNEPLGPAVSTGSRTIDFPYGVFVNAHSAGDHYGFFANVGVDYVGQAGQSHFFNRATGAIVGGSINLSTDGVYGTGSEMTLIQVSGYNSGIAMVMNLIRNDDTFEYGVTWGGYYLASSGQKPIDWGMTLKGHMRVGVDLTGADLTSNNQAAINLTDSQRIYFNSVQGSGSGLDHRGDSWYGNTLGDAYIQHISNSLLLAKGAGALSVQTTGVNITGSVAVSNGISIAANGLSVAGGLTVSSGTTTLQAITGNSLSLGTGTITSGAITSSGDISAGSGTVVGKYLRTQQETGAGQHFLFFGDQSNGASYLIVDTSAGQAALYVKGVQKQLWS